MKKNENLENPNELDPNEAEDVGARDVSAPPPAQVDENAEAQPVNIRILLPTNRTKDVVVSQAITTVLQAMRSENMLFPTPAPALADVEKANNEFAASIRSEETRSKLSDTVTRKLRGKVLALFTQLSLYVLSVAKGDTEIVDRSGFKRQGPRKKPVRNRQPKTPIIKNSFAGKANGTAVLLLSAMGGAKFFIVEIKTAAGEWKFLDANNLLRIELDNLTSGMVTLRVWGKSGKVYSPQPSAEVTLRVL